MTANDWVAKTCSASWRHRRLSASSLDAASAANPVPDVTTLFSRHALSARSESHDRSDVSAAEEALLAQFDQSLATPSKLAALASSRDLHRAANIRGRTRRTFHESIFAIASSSRQGFRNTTPARPRFV
ncbi:hypothetical protein [Caballeronia temeraria]|uniref:hypothetical protein n=1 Tax=Caballeronia temeraria TaxID=1777137 RepID=UPI0012FD9232|nr:hypothetical protein [Caballeronia temeraria]